MIDTLLGNIGISEEEETLLDTNIEVGADGTTTSSSLSSGESISSSPLLQQTSLTDNSINLDESLTFSIENPINELPNMHLDEQMYEEINYQNVSKEHISFEVTQNGILRTPLSFEEQHNLDFVSSNSPIDIDNLINIPNTDNLEVSNEDINKLQEKVEGVKRSEHKREISFGSKMCPSRHGCQGATDCDYSYGSYPG